MQYSEFAELYEKLGESSGRLDKVVILADFLKKLHKKGKSKWIYLLKGKVSADYESGEFGISTQLIIKAIGSSYGVKSEDVMKRVNKIGDLGEVAEEFAGKRKQGTLFSSKLTVEKVFDNLSKLSGIEGKGTVEKKIDLISELLASASSAEAKYIIRTILGDLRIGVADGVIRDAIVEAFFPGRKSEITAKVESAYDLSNDFALVLNSAALGEKEIDKVDISPGKPMNVMLANKVASIAEGFEVCGKPAAFEHKYDGFRMLISKDRNGKIALFTRRLESATKQFPDVVSAVEKYVKGSNFILDSEVVGYDSKTKKYTPFQSMSQRIKRKYDIDKLIKTLPVEINVFDVIYYDNKNVMDLPFSERRKIVEKIVSEKKLIIKTAEQLVTDSEEKAEKFYEEALEIGEEGVMIKSLSAPYKPGRRVGYMVKLKPVVEDLDLVIVGAEHGTGKRGGWLTSYIVACKDGERLVEIGKVASGLKELEGEGTTYDEMTKLLKPLVISTEGNVVRVKPKVVVAVTYQDIQKSPSYSSGYALRFPRITAYRPDRRVDDIATLKDIEKEVKKMQRK